MAIKQIRAIENKIVELFEDDVEILKDIGRHEASIRDLKKERHTAATELSVLKAELHKLKYPQHTLAEVRDGKQS